MAAAPVACPAPRSEYHDHRPRHGRRGQANGSPCPKSRWIIAIRVPRKLVERCNRHPVQVQHDAYAVGVSRVVVTSSAPPPPGRIVAFLHNESGSVVVCV